MTNPVPPSIENILSSERLAALRGAYNTPEGSGEMNAILRGTLPDLYARSKPYIDAILEIFYGQLPDDMHTDRPALSAPDRERCIIALLAVQHGGFVLAIHIYLALMLGLSATEIAHILLLAGVYGGVSTFAEGITVAVQTLTKLEAMTVTHPKEVYAALRA